MSKVTCGTESEAHYVVPLVLSTKCMISSKTAAWIPRILGAAAAVWMGELREASRSHAGAFSASDMRAFLPIFCAHQDCLDVPPRNSSSVEVPYLTGPPKHCLPLSDAAQTGCSQRNRLFRQGNHTLRFSFANYKIILPLMSISNSSHLLCAWIYQLLEKKCLWDPVTSSCPSCCWLHLGRDRQLPAVAHSLHISQYKRSLCAPLGL